MADEMKIGAYVCGGCGISERLDVDQLVTTATRDGKAKVGKQHEFLCSAAGVKMIQDDIDNDGVNRVVVVGCSRRAKTEAFRFEGAPLTIASLISAASPGFRIMLSTSVGSAILFMGVTFATLGCFSALAGPSVFWIVC